jgi:hypothetical protein
MTMQCLFEFKFVHTNPAEDDIFMTEATEVNPVHKIADVKSFVLEAIKQLNSTHAQEQIISSHIKLLEEVEL